MFIYLFCFWFWFWFSLLLLLFIVYCLQVCVGTLELGRFLLSPLFYSHAKWSVAVRGGFAQSHPHHVRAVMSLLLLITAERRVFAGRTILLNRSNTLNVGTVMAFRIHCSPAAPVCVCPILHLDRSNCVKIIWVRSNILYSIFSV